MAFEMLVGLEVTDEAKYQQYRDQMTPLLHARGGEFRYDFRIATVLKSEANHPINRVFILAFPNRATRDEFFASEKYLAVRGAFFDSAVKGRTILSEFER